MLAILDVHESGGPLSQYTHDDGIAFLEAVRNAAVVAKNAHPPTDKMLDAIFKILRTGMSMESAIHFFSNWKCFSARQAPCSSPACSMEWEHEPLKEVLHEDFSSRKIFSKETKDWIVLRESLLNMILSSRKMNKDLIKFAYH
ncbi:hypothetical protein MLD38_010065 [Melastoma candidum]|uniref:Uncharacterized protein n=1 Tax=Melastoma candidum TaxID=119954 RepID=A0ACB9QZ73_9MYRT|nr:hypothetical protein MLD38_010065 [Melastoma candidum]